MVEKGELGGINGYRRVVETERKREMEKVREKTGEKVQRNEGKIEEKDKLIISDAEKISGALRLMEDIPDLREDLVVKFKEMIENGEYEIDLDKLVDIILKEVLP
ncbi:MAG: flagellar biosynthesis anti-sigma factor FlgM [Thermotogae bacterium]|nr:flagellar biosynthesis anti-sigma factor FlgM [Thermotogota bacterium]